MNIERQRWQAGRRHKKVSPETFKLTRRIEIRGALNHAKLATYSCGDDMENGELILAAHVRELAAHLVEERWLQVSEGLGLSKVTLEGREERARIKAEWRSANPIESFIAEAYRLIQEVAIQINRLR